MRDGGKDTRSSIPYSGERGPVSMNERTRERVRERDRENDGRDGSTDATARRSRREEKTGTDSRAELDELHPGADERAARMVEVEAELRDLTDRRPGEKADPAEAPPHHAEVTDARRDRDTVVFTGVDEAGRELEFTLPWPEDPTDEGEPLVRLLDWLDVDVRRFADVSGETVPLKLDADGNVVVHVPPVNAPGNALWFRTKRWGMRHGLVRYKSNGLVRGRVTSPYSATRLYLTLVTAVSLLVSTLGLVVVPSVVPIEGVVGWLVYGLVVGLPSTLVGGLALLLLPAVGAILGVKGYRWFKRRFFPSP